MLFVCCGIFFLCVCVFYFHFVLQWNVASTSHYCVRYTGGGDLAQPGHHAYVSCTELQVKHFDNYHMQTHCITFECYLHHES